MHVSARSLGALALVVGAGVAVLVGTASGAPASSVPSGWTIRDLGDLGGTGGSVATAINDKGDVVGYSDWTPAPGQARSRAPSGTRSSGGTAGCATSARSEAGARRSP